MKTTNPFREMAAQKLAVLKDQIAATKTSAAISNNTRGTTLYKLGRERRVLHLIDTLLTCIPEDTKLPDADIDTLFLITGQKQVEPRASIEVEEGDDILGLMKRYENKKNLHAKLIEVCEKKGLRLDYTTGKVVAK